ncbi:hypothetical protein FOL47_008942 [Perkinsus chesapeaki]|uniref:Alpha/beta hydrolase fold-3 domain-containing protein n=1 Tax=Perkinsus chesapeaki TaxID=330153 RepID=A0A7J6N2R3_PERCH|nr:hypothetical protein FOL47_008942 [Perkinsus chesapeaki]
MAAVTSMTTAKDTGGVSSPDDAEFKDCNSIDASRVDEQSIEEDSPKSTMTPTHSEHVADDSKGESKPEQTTQHSDTDVASDMGNSHRTRSHDSIQSNASAVQQTALADSSADAAGKSHVEEAGNADISRKEERKSDDEICKKIPQPISAIPVMPPPSDASDADGVAPTGEDPVKTEKEMKKQMTWGETWRSLTLAPRAAGVMMKVPIRRMFSKPRRPTWNTQMETYISVMRSAGKNAPRHDLRAVRAIANTTVPNILLPSGVFRCKQYIAFQERDGEGRLHQPVKIDWIWAKTVTPERDQSGHVLKECPTKEELQRSSVILYVHGGGFCMCSSGTHRHLLYTLALKTENCMICCVNYRQPPESSLLESTSDVECMYRYLISNLDVSPDRIAIAGDSAGGDMAVLALVQIRDKKIPLPGCACLLSPWVDLADKVDYFDVTPQQTPRELPGSESVTSSDRQRRRRRRNSSRRKSSDFSDECVDYLPSDLVVEFAQLAIGDISADDPRVSAMYADLRGLPHMLIHAGQAELLLPQIERFAAKFSAQKSNKVELEYKEFEDMVHVFQLFSFCCGPDEAPNRSLSDIADFIQRHTQPRAPSDDANPLS